MFWETLIERAKANYYSIVQFVITIKRSYQSMLKEIFLNVGFVAILEEIYLGSSKDMARIRTRKSGPGLHSK